MPKVEMSMVGERGKGCPAVVSRRFPLRKLVVPQGSQAWCWSENAMPREEAGYDVLSIDVWIPRRA